MRLVLCLRVGIELEAVGVTLRHRQKKFGLGVAQFQLVHDLTLGAFAGHFPVKKEVCSLAPARSKLKWMWSTWQAIGSVPQVYLAGW